jgi:hypothetical protein
VSEEGSGGKRRTGSCRPYGNFLDAQKALEVTRKYMCLFGIKDCIIITYNKLENEVYRLRAQ